MFHSVVEGSEGSFYLNADHSIIILSCILLLSKSFRVGLREIEGTKPCVLTVPPV